MAGASAATTREDAFGWFQDRFNALKSAPYYLPVLRDFGVIELERGRNGAVRLTEMGALSFVRSGPTAPVSSPNGS